MEIIKSGSGAADRAGAVCGLSKPRHLRARYARCGNCGGQWEGVCGQIPGRGVWERAFGCKAGTPQAGGFPRTSELMQAVDYCFRKAEEYGKPLVINLSFGNNYGSHSGTSLIETYLSDMANRWRSSLVIGSGNEGASAVHTAELL